MLFLSAGGTAIYLVLVVVLSAGKKSNLNNINSKNNSPRYLPGGTSCYLLGGASYYSIPCMLIHAKALYRC